jgi:hypothetical protein
MVDYMCCFHARVWIVGLSLLKIFREIVFKIYLIRVKMPKKFVQKFSGIPQYQ